MVNIGIHLNIVDIDIYTDIHTGRRRKTNKNGRCMQYSVDQTRLNTQRALIITDKEKVSPRKD